MFSDKTNAIDQPSILSAPFADETDSLTQRARELELKDAEFAAKVKALEEQDLDFISRINAANGR